MDNLCSLLWRYARADRPILQGRQLQRIPKKQVTYLAQQGYLKRTDNATVLLVGDQLVEVTAVANSAGEYKPCYMDEYGSLHWLQPSDLFQYTIDFSPLARLIREGLNCRGVPEEPLPGKAWKIGAAGQQSREVYLVRKWAGDSSVQALLGSVKDSSLVFHIGQRPAQFHIGKRSSGYTDTPKGEVMEAQYYAVDTLIDINDEEGSLVFDGDTVHQNLKDMFASRPQRKKTRQASGKQDNATETIQNLLWALVDCVLEIAQKADNGEDINATEKQRVGKLFRSQKELGDTFGVPEYEFSRAVLTWQQDQGGFGGLYLKMRDLVVRKPTKANTRSSGQRIDRLNDFYRENRDQIERLRTLHPHPSNR